METTQAVRIIDQVREITANEVAKKQDAAKLNYPKIIEKIKSQASLGNSQCTLSSFEMNEYDKKLLEQDGFSVRLEDDRTPKDFKESIFYQQHPLPIKIWVIKW